MISRGTGLTHIAGTFLVQADGAFLNGAGLGEGEDRNVTIPKTFRDGRHEVPYVSAQAWKRWLRSTAVVEAGWIPSEPQAIGWNPKGNVNKIAGELNPVDFPEDDIFGYMRAQEGQGRRKAALEEVDEGEEEERESLGRVRSVMRSSPFAASLLVSLRSSGWRGEDEGFVHLTRYDPRALAEAELRRFLQQVTAERRGKSEGDVWKRLEEFGSGWASEVRAAVDAPNLQRLRELLSARSRERGKEIQFIENPTSPLPYTTRFYNTNLQAVFCLDYSRLGVFWNLGDRVELEETKAKEFLRNGRIEDVTSEEPYRSLSQNGSIGRVYRLAEAERVRKERAKGLFRALGVLRGGAKQSQFGVDIAPKVLILAGLSCGNPIFNHLFADDGNGPVFKVQAFREVLRDYGDRIVTPVLFGLRSGYLRNEDEARALNGWYEVVKGDDPLDGAHLEGPVMRRGERGQWIRVNLMTPVEASLCIGGFLP